ncbi:MAG: DUF2515 family protein [Telluria sp.]
MPDDSLSACASQTPSSDAAADWLACQREAEEWIAPGGKLVDEPALRNRRISAAYASLWLQDRRLQWAALAAFASRQVGCSMAHAGQAMRDLSARIRGSETADGFEWLYKVMIPALVGSGEGYLRGQLSLGNLAVFLDVYPLHRFYLRHGLPRLRDTLGARKQLADSVHWPVGAQVLPFGQPFREIVDAFALIDAGSVPESVLKLAWHEQVNVLQRVIYDDPKTRLALDGNQFGAAIGGWPAQCNPIELVFGSSCTAADAAGSTAFSARADAHLYDVGQRMEFVSRAASQLDALVRSQRRAEVESALRRVVADARLA